MSTKDGRGRKIQPIAQRSVPAGRPHLVPLLGVNGDEPRMGPSLAGRGASPAVPVCNPEPFLPPYSWSPAQVCPQTTGAPQGPRSLASGRTHLSETFSEPTNRLLLRRPARVPRKAMSTTCSDSLRADRAEVVTAGPGRRDGGTGRTCRPLPAPGPPTGVGGGRWVGLSGDAARWPSAVSIPGLDLPSLVGPLGLCPSACTQLCGELALEDRRNPGREILSRDLRKVTPCDQHTLSTSPCEALFKCLPYS